MNTPSQTGLKSLLLYLRPHRARFFRINIFYLFNALLNLVPAATVGVFVDIVISERSTRIFGLTLDPQWFAERFSKSQMIWSYLLFMLGLILVANLFGVIMWRRMTDAVQLVLIELKMDIRAHLNRLSMSYFQREQTGAIMERALGDVQRTEMLFKTWFFLFYNLLQFLIAPVLMIALSPTLFVAVLIPTPLIIYSVYTIQTRLKPLYRELREKESSAASIMQETVSGIREIKAYTMEDQSNAKYENVQQSVRDQNLDIMKVFSVSHQVQYSTQDLALVFLSAGGAWMLWGGNGAITAGTITSFIALTGHFFNPIRTFVGIFETIQRGLVSWDRIREFLNEEAQEWEDPEGLVLHPNEVKGQVTFQGIHFGYNSERKIIDNFSLEVAPGEKIGLVGTTGCGKSTLMSLLLRFYDPTQGEILLDGKPVSQINRRSLRSQIGIVFQDTFLFYGTIRDNLLFVNPNKTIQELEKACDAAGILQRIQELPQGFDTMVGERGQQLSGGERQRFSIARLLLKNPAIVILDEATSALDTATEIHVQESFDRLLNNRTAFVIAHRLSTVKNCGRILVLDAGQVVEQGTHHDLLAQQGVYANLWSQGITTEPQRGDIP
ncbi:ABC transporter ATP-binding protein [Kiritimatiellaeota bacterium B1221]|nr:ABC transporter ATP-binding protein [Kiritimatiellaeota bacterium B1221]